MIKYGLDVDMPGLEKGAPVELSLLGTFENGKITELDVHSLKAFLVSTGRDYKDLKDLSWPSGVTMVVTADESFETKAEEPAAKKAPEKEEGSK